MNFPLLCRVVLSGFLLLLCESCSSTTPMTPNSELEVKSVLAGEAHRALKDRSTDQNVQVVEGALGPTLRFPVAHSDGMGGARRCYGYLEISASRIAYRPNKKSEHAFDVAREAVEDFHLPSFLGIVEHFNLRVSGVTHLMIHVTKRMVDGELSAFATRVNRLDQRDVERAIRDFPAALAAAASTGASQGAPHTVATGRSWHDPLPVATSGIYRLEEGLGFNVVDGAYFEPLSGQVTLFGHHDSRYETARIPYLQHLSALLQHPRPELTLEWTPDSERRVKTFLTRTELLSESREAAKSMAQFLDQRTGKVNDTGRLLLPAFGIKPTRNGAAQRGYLGVQVAQEGEAFVRIIRVAPGSPADAAGLRVGDVIDVLRGYRPLSPAEFQRVVGFQGAGNQLGLAVAGRPPQYIKLGAAPGDPWAEMDWHEVLYQLMVAGGPPMAPAVVERIYARDRAHGTPAFWTGFGDFLDSINMLGELVRLRKLHGDTDQMASLLFPQVASRLEELLELPRGSIRDHYVTTFARTGDHLTAGVEMDEAVNEMMYFVVERAFSRIRAKAGGVQLAPELVDRAWGVRPEVGPRFMDMQADTPLAQTMLLADYLGKRLVNAPELKNKFPSYMTQYEFMERNPAFARDRAAFRMWISVDSMRAAQSPDRSTYEIRDIKMRFNVREIADGARVASGQRDDYGEMLTGIYDGLATEFPILHELREAAKLSGIAHWILTRDPRFRLPSNSAVSWRAPAKLPGFVFVYLGGGSAHGKAPMTTFATGGVRLSPYEWTGKGDIDAVAPVDAGVVDLRHLVLPTRNGVRPVLEAPVYENTALARILKRKIEVPMWRPEGWVARAQKGERTLTFISATRTASKCNSVEQAELLRQLELTAAQLDRVERMINRLNAPSPRLQAELSEIGTELATDRDAFVDDTISLLADRLLHARYFMKNLQARRALRQVLNAGASANKTADAIDTVSQWEKRLKTARTGTPREQAGAVLALLQEMHKTLEKRYAPEVAELREAFGGWVEQGRYFIDTIETFSKLFIFQALDVNRLNREVEVRNAALASIEPIHLKLSREVDLLRNHPALKELCGTDRPHPAGQEVPRIGL